MYSSAIRVCILEGSLDDYANFSDGFFPFSRAVQILYGVSSHFDFFSTTVYVSLTKNKSPEEAILKVAWMCFN